MTCVETPAILTSEHWMKNVYSRLPQSILPLSSNQLTINKQFLSKSQAKELSPVIKSKPPAL